MTYLLRLPPTDLSLSIPSPLANFNCGSAGECTPRPSAVVRGVPWPGAASAPLGVAVRRCRWEGTGSDVGGRDEVLGHVLHQLTSI
jgi:hypothetical protein